MQDLLPLSELFKDGRCRSRYLYEVHALNLSYNQLQTINGTRFVYIVTIQRLDLSHNQLETINGTSFIHLSSLQELDLSHNLLETIFFDTVLSVKILDLSFNLISDIYNDTFVGLHQLKDINLGFQNYKFIWRIMLHGAVFASCTALQRINMTKCDIMSLPPSIFHGLHQLEMLDISGYAMSLPSSLFQGLTNLVHLDMSSNNMDFKPQTAGMFDNLVGLKYLDVSGNWIEDIAERLFLRLVSLENLALSNTGLTTVPKTLIANCPRITNLDISRNNINATPCAEIQGLQLLTTLDLRYNKFSYLTCPITNLVNFKKLHLSESMDCELTPCTEYWNATIWSNLITWTPKSLSTLYLHIYGDTIFQSTVDRGLKLNSSVSSLIITYCPDSFGYPPISFEDDAFGMLPHLQILTIHGCKPYDFQGIDL